jgi:hypothetical protein
VKKAHGKRVNWDVGGQQYVLYKCVKSFNGMGIYYRSIQQEESNERKVVQNYGMIGIS